MIPPETWRSEVCAGLDATMVAKALHERGILDREPKSYQKQHWVGGRNVRAYTITAHVFDAEAPARPARDVRGPDTKDFCDHPGEALAAKKPPNTKGLTGLTGLAGQGDTEPVCTTDGSEPVCVQCGAGQDLESHRTGTGKTILLHEECVRAWRDEFWNDDDLTIPGGES
jgi:hypothetical protein